MALSTLAKATLILLFTANLSADGQTSKQELETLRGLRSVRLDVLPLRAESAAKCNLTQDSLALAAARPLLDAGIKIANESAQVAVVVSVNVFQVTAAGGCAANLDIEAVVPAITTLIYQATDEEARSFAEGRARPRTVVLVRLWKDGSTMVDLEERFARRVTEEIRAKLEAFATKVRLANQGKGSPPVAMPF